MTDRLLPYHFRLCLSVDLELSRPFRLAPLLEYILAGAAPPTGLTVLRTAPIFVAAYYV